MKCLIYTHRNTETDLIQNIVETNNIKKLDLTSTISATSDKIKFAKKILWIKIIISQFVWLILPILILEVSYQMERDFDIRTTTANNIEWTQSKKNVSIYKSEFGFSHKSYRYFADI
jgi:hypothetical protein